VAAAPERVDDFTAFMAVDDEERHDALRRSEGTGRPLGAPEFVAGLERLLGRPIARRALGRKPRGLSMNLDLLQ
jgi:hypothetical protein